MIKLICTTQNHTWDNESGFSYSLADMILGHILDFAQEGGEYILGIQHHDLTSNVDLQIRLTLSVHDLLRPHLNLSLHLWIIKPATSQLN